MTTPVIMDAAVMVVLVGFAVFGARRGLLKSLAGLLMVVVALVGAGMIASTFARPVTKAVAPMLETRIGQKVEKLIEESQLFAPGEADGAENPAALEALLELLGLDREVQTQLKAEAQETIREQGTSLAAAVVESLVQSFVYGALLVLSFLLLLLLLHILVGAMDLVMKLPVLHGLNTLGGGILGLLEGALLVFLAVWAARRFGVSFETGTLAQSHILQIFTGNTPMSVLSFLQ